MRSLRNGVLLVACLLITGCYSMGEKIRAVNFEMKAENPELEPHERRLEEARDLAEPR